MDIHEKINLKDNAYMFLEWSQYEQLIKRNLLSLAPYYNDMLITQRYSVEASEKFVSVFGMTRNDYENRLRK